MSNIQFGSIPAFTNKETIMPLQIHDYGEQVNKDPNIARKTLEEKYGEVWDTQQLQTVFDVIGFAAPCVVVVRKVDGVKGSLEFTHSPRYYHSFVKA